MCNYHVAKIKWILNSLACHILILKSTNPVIWSCFPGYPLSFLSACNFWIDLLWPHFEPPAMCKLPAHLPLTRALTLPQSPCSHHPWEMGVSLVLRPVLTLLWSAQSGPSSDWWSFLYCKFLSSWRPLAMLPRFAWSAQHTAGIE